MAELLKHVGLYGEKPCVVVFRELPEEPDNALICISNSLEGQLHDDVMSVVDSRDKGYVGCELLARLRFQNKNLSPDFFIPIIESCGFYPELD